MTRTKIVSFGAMAAVLAMAATYIAITSTASAGSNAPATSDPSSQERAILADGQVTLGELNHAMESYRACGEALGYHSIVEPTSGLRPETVNFGHDAIPGVSAEELSQRAMSDLAGCRAKTLDAATAAWLRQSTEPDQATLEALYSRLSGCVAAGGVPAIDVEGRSFSWMAYRNAPAEGMTIQEAELGAYAQCALQAYADTGIAPPTPNVIRD